MAYFPIIRLEELDYRRSLKARPPAALLVEQSSLKGRLNYCDIGARGELPNELIGYEELLYPILFEPDELAARALEVKWQGNAQVHRIAVGPKGTHNMWITKTPGCSSLLNPLGEGRRHVMLSQGERAFKKVEVISRQELRCQPLAQVVDFEKQPIDILKIDAQGFDYEVISTLGLHRPFLIKIEVSTIPIYQGQRTLGAVLNHLEALGYMAVRLPFTKAHSHASFERGFGVSVGDLIAVPDFSDLGQSMIHRDPTSWRTSLMLFGFSDLANHQESIIYG